MTKKTFQAIAAVLAGDLATCTDDGQRLKVRGIALSLADVLAAGNSAFDRGRFYRACGLTDDGALPPRYLAVKK